MARSLGLEIVEVEWKMGKQRFLRVYIDRPPARKVAGTNESAVGEAEGRDGQHSAEGSQGGISHKDCEAVSNQLSVILDVEDLIPGGHYLLEVSSPGLDRKLLKPADYERFVGRKAKIFLQDAVENSKYFEGRLAGFENGNVRLELKGREVQLPFTGIRKANLVVEF
ncbi:MAG: ribosome maturation factor RimP [Acidobacteria bacterium]|nr:ribosome maturation factor RimP [Acidobacteriota bacterium]